MPEPRRLRPLLALACSSGALALLAGCGGQTKTVYVSSPSASSASTTPAHTTSTSASTPTTTATSPSEAAQPPGGGSSGTRTAPAPAFTEGKNAGSPSDGGLRDALAVLREHGYTSSDSADYHPDQTLQVLVGTRTGTNDGYRQQAFFFLDGHYLGTDASVPSAEIKVLSQSDTEVTLGYALYRANDPLCCPGAGQGQVTFQLNNGKLMPAGTIPPAASASAPSRR